MSLEVIFENYLKQRYLGASYLDIEQMFENTSIEKCFSKEYLIALYTDNEVECDGIISRYCSENDIKLFIDLELNTPENKIALAFRYWLKEFKHLFFRHYKLPEEFKDYKSIIFFTKSGLVLEVKKVPDRKAFREQFTEGIEKINDNFMFKG